MPHFVWRIAADTPEYGSDDLSGRGAEKTGGRWNRKGIAMLYTSGSMALACLETIVHLAGSDPLPLNRFLVQIDVPDDVWRSREIFDARAPGQVGWDAEPAGRVSLNWGTAWARSMHSLVAEVPSVVVPEESNYLVNSKHPDVLKLIPEKRRRWFYDTRF